MLRYHNSGCTRNSPSSSVVSSPLSNRQLQNVLVTAQLYSKNYCTPISQMRLQKHWAWCLLTKSNLGAVAEVERDSPGWSPQGQSRQDSTQGQSSVWTAWDNICVTLTAASEYQSPLSAEVCQGIHPSLAGGLGGAAGAFWVLGCRGRSEPTFLFLKSWLWGNPSSLLNFRAPSSRFSPSPFLIHCL